MKRTADRPASLARGVQALEGGSVSLSGTAMENATYIALSREVALRRQMDVVANNLANISTPAFKGQTMLFKEYVAQLEGGESMSYVQEDRAVRDMTEGPMTPTGGPLDLAIHGEGYFVVNTPLGPRYTRAGSLRIDATGQIVTTDGHPIANDQNRSIVVPATSGEIIVARDGTVSTPTGSIGRLQIVRFDDDQALREVASGLFDADAAPQPNPEAEIVQGMIEESNVQGVVELTRMMAILRSYQSIQRMLDNEHERERQAIGTITSSSS